MIRGLFERGKVHEIIDALEGACVGVRGVIFVPEIEGGRFGFVIVVV